MSIGPAKRRIPTTIQNRLGDGRLEKGRWNLDGETSEDGFYLLAWDFAKECDGEKCPIWHLCEYKNSWHMKKEKQGQPGGTSRCMLHQRYLKNVIHAVVQKMYDRGDMTQEGVIKLGYQLLPLYDQLFKFKMWEYSNEQLVYISEKGTPKVHPIYKEIREIVKTISGVWREIGGVDKAPANPKNVGDESFIDAISSGTGQEPQEVTENVSQEGTGMDFSASEAEAPKKRKKSGVNHKKKKERARRKISKAKKKDKVVKDVPPYHKRHVQNEEDNE